MWFLTGEEGDTLQTVRKEGNLDLLVSQYAEKAPRVEIEADVEAVGVLQRAGVDPNNLVSALIKLHEIYVDVEDVDEFVSSEKVRYYPSLQQRLYAIEEAMNEMDENLS